MQRVNPRQQFVKPATNRNLIVVKHSRIMTPQEQRQALLLEQAQVNAELRQRKMDFALGCANGQRGRYLPTIECVRLKGRIDELKSRRKNEGMTK
jgi:hypothetical protein